MAKCSRCKLQVAQLNYCFNCSGETGTSYCSSCLGTCHYCGNTFCKEGDFTEEGEFIASDDNYPDGEVGCLSPWLHSCKKVKRNPDDKLRILRRKAMATGEWEVYAESLERVLGFTIQKEAINDPTLPSYSTPGVGNINGSVLNNVEAGVTYEQLFEVICGMSNNQLKMPVKLYIEASEETSSERLSGNRDAFEATGVAIDSRGQLYIGADYCDHCSKALGPLEMITTVDGSGAAHLEGICSDCMI